MENFNNCFRSVVKNLEQEIAQMIKYDYLENNQIEDKLLADFKVKIKDTIKEVRHNLQTNPNYYENHEKAKQPEINNTHEKIDNNYDQLLKDITSNWLPNPTKNESTLPITSANPSPAKNNGETIRERYKRIVRANYQKIIDHELFYDERLNHPKCTLVRILKSDDMSNFPKQKKKPQLHKLPNGMFLYVHYPNKDFTRVLKCLEEVFGPAFVQ